MCKSTSKIYQSTIFFVWYTFIHLQNRYDYHSFSLKKRVASNFTKTKNNKPLTLFIMKKFFAAVAIVLFTVTLTTYNNTNEDQIAGDDNSTQMQEPGGQGGVIIVKDY